MIVNSAETCLFLERQEAVEFLKITKTGKDVDFDELLPSVYTHNARSFHSTLVPLNSTALRARII
jgi:hypothetical protein